MRKEKFHGCSVIAALGLTSKDGVNIPALM